MRELIILSLALFGAAFVTLKTGPVATPRPNQWAYVREGVGVDDIVLGTSSKADVLAHYGNGHKLIEHNEYSVELKYAEAGLSFYHCLNDDEKKIFVAKVRLGVTSKGIVIGQSTLQDVFDKYGKPEANDCCDAEPSWYEYKGVRFHVERVSHDVGKKQLDSPSNMKVTQIDVVPSTQSSNFCDGI